MLYDRARRNRRSIASSTAWNQQINDNMVGTHEMIRNETCLGMHLIQSDKKKQFTDDRMRELWHKSYKHGRMRQLWHLHT